MKITCKIILVLIGSILICQNTAQAQPLHMKCRVDYNYIFAAKITYKYLLKGDNYEPFSDNRKREEIFPSKSVFKGKSKLEILPILNLKDRESLRNSSSAKSLHDLFQPDYSQFAAFLLCENQLVELIVSSPIDLNHNTMPSNFGTDSSVDLDSLYKAFDSKGVCLFYDVALRTYSFISNDDYIFWDYNANKFSNVHGVDGYKRLLFSGRAN